MPTLKTRVREPPPVRASGWTTNRIASRTSPARRAAGGIASDELLARMQAFGYTTETMQFMLLPLIRELRDPVGSMGNDSALACLSDKPRMPTTTSSSCSRR